MLDNIIGRLRMIVFVAIIILLIGGCTVSTESYNYESAYSQFNKGNYVEAKNTIDKVIYKNGDSSKAEFKEGLKQEYLILAGHIYFENLEFDNAILQFKEAYREGTKVSVLENNKEAYRGQGLSYSKKGEVDKATECFDKALKIDVNESLDEDIAKYKIEAYIDAGKSEEALKLCETFVKEYQRDDSINILEGMCYAQVYNEEKMLERINSVAKNGNSAAYYHLAKGYMMMGNYDKAYENLKVYVDKAKNLDAKVLALALLECLMVKQDYDTALELIGSFDLTKNKKYDKELLRYQVVVLEKKGDYATALTKANEYLNIYKDDEDMKKEVSFINTRIQE